MALWMIAAGLLALAAAAFLLEPMVRSEEDLEALRFPSGAGRDGRRASAALKAGSRVEPSARPHCGAEVERDYDYCGGCVRRLPG
jgi:hypothetical protein